MKLKCGQIKLVIVFTTSLLIQNTLLASESSKNEMSVAFGMVSASFTETQSAVKEEASTTTSATSNESSQPQSGTVSAMSLDLSYNFLADLKKSYYVRTVIPVMASNSTGYVLGAMGMNFYFYSLASTNTVRDQSSSISIIPKMRYYIGPEAGVGYLIYATKTAEKSDVVFELGGRGGAIYNFKKDWGAKAELSAARGTGVATTSFIIKAVFGLTFHI